MARLIFDLGSRGTVEFPLTAPVARLGRARDNDIILDHTWISAHHAEFHRQGGTLTLRDAGSTNGTLVNGQPITERLLEEGDRIQFGQVEVVFSAELGGETPGKRETAKPPMPRVLPMTVPVPRPLAAAARPDPPRPAGGG